MHTKLIILITLRNKITLSEEGEKQLVILNAIGTQVYSATFNANETLVWNGCDNSGAILATVLYLFTIRNEQGVSYSGRMIKQ